MTDTKAALDAQKNGLHPAYVQERIRCELFDYFNGTMSLEKCNELELRLRRFYALTTPPAPTVMGDDVREAIKDWESMKPAFQIENWDNAIRVVETLIRAATAPRTTDVLCRTCKGDPETCAGIPDARKVYGFHNGKALSCHPLGVESAIETFLRFNGAVFVDGKPAEKFGIATAAMSSAIQAYLDYYRNGVGDTDETRKSY